MIKHASLIVTVLFTLLWLFPPMAFAAESASVNPPGWVGGFLAFLSLALAIGAGIWIRKKQL